LQFKDYYVTLGVARDASQDDIKRAYRKLARRYHPDVSDESDAEERFKEIGEAYEVLKDPEKRAAYDQFGKDWKAGQEFKPPPGWDAGFEFSGAGPGASGFSDFFETLFGDGRMGGFTRGRRGYTRGPADFGGFGGGRAQLRGEDHHARVLVSLEDAYAGGSRTLTLRNPGVGVDGRVSTQARSIRVTIPKGVKAGQRIRLTGQGSLGAGGAPAGDLYLEIGFEPHPLFEVEERDILLTLPVAPWEAALGATVDVPTLGGTVTLKIPAGSQAGKRLRLRGRGLPGKPPGDQIVSLQIETPPADTADRRAFYEQMRDEMPFDPRARLGR
jgi:curved DNA-binding protein